MKNTNSILFMMLAFMFLTLSAYSQENNSVKLLNENNKKVKKIPKILESESKDRLFLILNHDNIFHKETNGFATQWYSRGIGVNFMYDFQIKKSEFSIAPGIGYNFASYYHNTTMVEDSSGISFPIIHDLAEGDDFKRGSLSVHYIDIPVEIRYRHKFDNKMSLKLALGVKAGIKINATSLEVRNGPNDYVKHYKTSAFKDVNQFRVGPTFRIGYGPVNLVGFYNLLPLFNKGRGPEMNTFSLGIAFTTL